jgi:sulfur carrier protein
MDVTCEVVGEGTEQFDLDPDATYGDVLRALGYSQHEASVLVDGSPVPEDAPVETDDLQVLRLIKGG